MQQVNWMRPNDGLAVDGCTGLSAHPYPSEIPQQLHWVPTHTSFPSSPTQPAVTLPPAHMQVRLKRFLEMRGADGGPWRMICALPALWVGLIYEPQAQAEALDLISSWTQDDRDYLREGGNK